jgi:peptide-methionine (S)-S-oxide reductase
MESKNQIAIFGGGCFWCTEAVFGELRGVISVMPGYSGGTVPNPTYEQVSTGTTGHAEVTRVEYDASQISFHDLLTVFFATHDPTTRNRQGNDVGTQYRSAIFYTTPEQKVGAEKFIKDIEEDYHRQYFKNHPDAGYCQLIIEPKVEKLQKQFASLLKEKSK